MLYTIASIRDQYVESMSAQLLISPHIMSARNMTNSMNYYYAPMEGITGYVFRRVHHDTFPGIAKYYTPFVVAGYTHHFKNREMADVDPANNAGVPTVPQVLANRAEDFLWAAEYLQGLGYQEVNLNLGCPVGTVSAKRKGSGFLQVPDELDRFLDAVFAKAAVPISIKTRIGYDSPEEAARLMEIYNQYPIHELTVHPRTRQEFYNGMPHLEVMDQIMAVAQVPVIYNGNICTVSDGALVTNRYPGIAGIMIGRGMLADPALVRRLQGGPAASKAELKAYHQALLEAHEAVYENYSPKRKGGEVIGAPAELALINRMKEIWFYLSQSYKDSDRYLKMIRKARTLVEYRAAVRMLQNNCELTEPANGL